MWLKIYIAVILLIVIVTLLWYWRELQHEKKLLKDERSGKFTKKEPFLEMLEEKKIDPDFGTLSSITKGSESTLSPEVIKLEMRAYPDQPYMGYELLQALLSAGFRYGEMNVFNRYAEDGKTILFSLGVSSPTHSFELSTMGGFSCSGLVMTMTLEGSNLSRILDLMLNTATELAEDLGGELLDENQSPLNDEIIKQWRDRIRVFEVKTSAVFVGS